MAALQRRGPVALDRIELQPRLPKGWVPKISRMLPPQWTLRAIYGLDVTTVQRPDLIVSAGGLTLGANVALARVLQAPNIFSGSTRGFPLESFRLVLTPYASVAGPKNVFAGPKPTPFDPDRFAAPRPLRTREDIAGAKVSILIGGPTPYADFAAADWQRLAHLIESLVVGCQCGITVVTSPRTPAAAYQALEPVCARQAEKVDMIDFRRAGSGSIDKAFACDIVMVTSDSMSMMTEAALSRRPAVALSPQRTAPNKDDEAVAGLVASKWLSVLPLTKTDGGALLDAALALEPMRENHLDRLADLISINAGVGGR